MKKLLALFIILSTSACANLDCGANRVDSATFNQCINERMMVPGRMGIIPAAEIDACSMKAAQVTKQMCGV